MDSWVIHISLVVLPGLYSIARAPRTAMPSEPTEPIVAAPAVLEALALASVAVPVPEEPVVAAVPLADDELPVVGVAPVPVLESVVGKVES